MNIFKKCKQHKKRLISWVVVPTVLISYCFLRDYIPEQIAINKAKAEVVTLVTSFEEGTLNDHSFKNKYFNENDDVRKVLPIIKEHLVALTEVGKIIEVDEKEVESTFVIKNLCTKNGIKKAKEYLENSSNLYVGYEKEYQKSKQLLKNNILYAFRDNPIKSKEYMKKIDEGKKETDELIKDYVMIEQIVIAKMLEIVDLFSDNLGKVREVNGNPIFKNQRAADRFNTLVAELGERCEIEDEIVARLENQQRIAMQKLKDFDKA